MVVEEIPVFSRLSLDNTAGTIWKCIPPNHQPWVLRTTAPHPPSACGEAAAGANAAS